MNLFPRIFHLLSLETLNSDVVYFLLEWCCLVQNSLVPKKVTRDELNSLVDRAADLIRTAVDYKFILVLLFLKRLNDLWKVEKSEVKNRLVKESGWAEEEADMEAERKDYHSVDIPKQFLWDEVTKDVNNLPQNLATGIGETAKLNSQLQGVINRVDFLEFARNQENRELLRQLVELFDKYNLGGEEVSPDVLGDAYEHILMKFAPDKAKEGEIYTPRPVIKLMVEILDPKPSESVYDPCCGSGGMLIISYLHVAEKYGVEETRRLFLFGQEKSPDIYAVGQMNLLLHDIKNANMVSGDTLDYPRFQEEGKLKQFDNVIANPPWNQDGYGEERLKKADFNSRFSFGYAPADKADWAWIQHMLSSSKNKVCVVLDTGSLSRTQGGEGTIRSQVAEKDWVECVILLPKKLFYNTGSAGAIIVFQKDKPKERKNKVLFVNAAAEFEKNPEIRRLNTLSAKNIDRLVEAYKEFKDIEDFAKVVELESIRKKNCKLSVSKYILLPSKEEPVNAEQIWGNLTKLEKERETCRGKVQTYLDAVISQKVAKGIGSTTFAQIQDEDIPESWEIKKIEDVCDILDSKRIPLNEETRAKMKGNIPYYGANGVVDHINDFIFDDKLILIAEDGGYFEEYATRSIAYMVTGKSWVNNHAHVLKVREKEGYSTEFVFYALEHKNILPFIEGSTRTKLNQEELRDITIALPKSKDEQERIALILTAMDNMIMNDSEIATHLEKLKNGIMHLLLSGAVEPR
jgi:type I restriction enzyme M protein